MPSAFCGGASGKLSGSADLDYHLDPLLSRRIVVAVVGEQPGVVVVAVVVLGEQSVVVVVAVVTAGEQPCRRRGGRRRRW